MESLLQEAVNFAQKYLNDIVQVNSVNDLWYYAIGIGLILVLMIVASYYTLKRIAIHLITGYAAIYIAQYFGIQVEPDAMMLTLMALFGPIPVLIAVGWHFLLN